MTTDKPPIDWERVEAQYRAGTLSVRELGVMHGISHTAINKKAKANGWTRDLKAKIHAQADAMVSSAAVSGVVSNVRPETEQAIVDANATVIANVRLQHRGSIRRAHTLVDALFAELEHQTMNPEVYERLLEAATEDMDKKAAGELRQALHRAIGVGNRVSAVARLTEAKKNVVVLERQAWGLDEPEKPADDLGDLSDEEIMGRLTDKYANQLAARGQA